MTLSSAKFVTAIFPFVVPLRFVKFIRCKSDLAQVFDSLTWPPYSTNLVLSMAINIPCAAACTIAEFTVPPLHETSEYTVVQLCLLNHPIAVAFLISHYHQPASFFSTKLLIQLHNSSHSALSSIFP